ncbi:hypothetical protein BJ085DRAFT_41477 [Dimargaris cristalligena]|uniref:TTI1 N-terminal TPR domain-containing protein n=1 Tax=Dimargaris cristalligena TaxID=215637 RepID=A0A4P9ZKA4_9FUNG|nr:hypothetical protein BJ085DRAFT_41477 [Dimargaris cristalligena]|eukprot:RKP33513.1 hypothetical protein BJ085DRAFT_41477 [Dimargaris cristalligena]
MPDVVQEPPQSTLGYLYETYIPRIEAFVRSPGDSRTPTGLVGEYATVLGRLITVLDRTLRAASGPHSAGPTEHLAHSLHQTLRVGAGFITAASQRDSQMPTACYRALLVALVALLCGPTVGARPELRITTYHCIRSLLELGLRIRSSASHAASFILAVDTPSTLELLFLLSHQCLEALASEDGPPELREAGAGVLWLIVDGVFHQHRDLLLNLLPGVLSCICRLLQRPSVITGPSTYLAQLIDITRVLIKATLADQPNQQWITRTEPTWSVLHGRQTTAEDKTAPEIKQSRQPTAGPGQSRSGPPLIHRDATWWTQTRPRVQSCLSIIMGLRHHAHWRVRAAVATFAADILTHCLVTLQGGLADLLETCVDLTADPLSEVHSPSQAILTTLTERCASDPLAHQLVHEELGRIVGRIRASPSLSLATGTLPDPTEGASQGGVSSFANDLSQITDGSAQLSITSSTNDAGLRRYAQSSAREVIRYMKVATAFAPVLHSTGRFSDVDLLEQWITAIVANIPLDERTPGSAVPLKIEASPSSSTGGGGTPNMPLNQLSPADVLTQFCQSTDQLLEGAALAGYREARQFVTALDRYLEHCLATQSSQLLQLIVVRMAPILVDSSTSEPTLTMERAQNMFFINRFLRALAHSSVAQRPNFRSLIDILEAYTKLITDQPENEGSRLETGSTHCSLQENNSTITRLPLASSERGNPVGDVVCCLAFEGQGSLGARKKM